MYTVQFFIDKFEKIPEDRWGIAAYHTSGGFKSCALGHCGAGLFNDEGCHIISEEACFIHDMVYKKLGLLISQINDGLTIRYQQPTPKQRILAALYDIKKSQQPTYEDITKSLAVLPIEEKSDQPVKEINSHVHQIFQDILKPYMP